MQKTLQIWYFINESLKQRGSVMLLYVLESKGSSPGRQGFSMVVNAKGEMEGSIGGGIMEHKFVEMVKERLKKQGSKEQELKKQIHDKSAANNQSGMICSGEQTIFLYPVREKDLNTVQKIIQSLEENKNGTLILSPDGILFSDAIPEKDFEFTFQAEDEWLYKEKTGYKNKLFIIGGGHCSLALSRLMRTMDFYVKVYDDRENLKTILENEVANERHFVKDYSVLTDKIPSGSNHYVVIMTFGYRTDDIALKALLNKEFKYIGVLGSKKKMEKLFEDYRKEGIDESLLQRIHTPIGLDIKSQTPEEIAVSIAAEIIKIKNATNS
ncbi:MAG: XdhC family protein [Chitinophagaceae bacterium]|nr:XdhC family protein [Chitinophagaceae bacterium]